MAAPGSRGPEPSTRTTRARATLRPSARQRSRPSRISLIGSSLRAGHARVDPGFQRFHELLVRERRSGAPGARGPGPEDERVRPHVLDDFLSAATAAVACRVLHLLADLTPGPALPQHGQGCEVPGGNARHEAVGGVRRLMARLARL